MTQKIFFSWQADTSPKTGRNLVERALERALAAVSADTELEEAVRELEIDRDTKGVPGSPPIVDTIFRKIDNAAVFIPDLTFVGTRRDGRPTPNPNVLIEYGWALKALSHSRIVPVMNTAHGAPTAEAMPFDMRHLRNPIQYFCPDDADEGTRREARTSLAKSLQGAIRDVLSSAEFIAGMQPAIPEVPFNARNSLNGPARFRKAGEPLGIMHLGLPGFPDTPIYLHDGPALWLRLMPSVTSDRHWSFAELEQAATISQHLVMPIESGPGSFGHFRADDGFGMYATTSRERGKTSLAYIAFETGEIWTVDAWRLSDGAGSGFNHIPLHEDAFANTLESYGRFLARLGVNPPYHWIAGMEGLKGKSIFIPVQGQQIAYSSNLRGPCVTDIIVSEGTYSPDQTPKAALRPFFCKIYDKCGVTRPAWLDN